MVRPYHDILFSNKEDLNVNIHNFGGYHWYYAKWKEFLSKDHIFTPFIQHSWNDQTVEMENRLVVNRDYMVEGGRCKYKGILCGDKISLYLDCNDDHTKLHMW